jgi:hypothetical protein
MTLEKIAKAVSETDAHFPVGVIVLGRDEFRAVVKTFKGYPVPNSDLRGGYCAYSVTVGGRSIPLWWDGRVRPREIALYLSPEVAREALDERTKLYTSPWDTHIPANHPRQAGSR